jgi:hypothetical protein
MGNRIFGTPKQPEEQKTPIRNIPSLHEQLVVLEKRRLHLEKIINSYEEQAKQSKTKDEAMRNLKLKLKHTDELKTVYAMLDKLEGLENARQRILFQKDIIKATEQATSAIKQNMVDADKVSDTMVEVENAIEEVDKVNQILSQSDAPNQDLEDEYNNLMAEKAIPKQEPVISINLPDVPEQEPAVKQPSQELRMLVSD